VPLICRTCRSDRLYPFLDLGFTPPADQFRRSEQLREPEVSFPLSVLMCELCGLAQLSTVVSPEILYRQDYPYESSTTRSGRDHWRSFADAVVKEFGLNSSDLVVDIGSNVGVLLDSFRMHGVAIQGVDPAANIVLLAERAGIDTICDFFNEDTVEAILSSKGPASVVTATNVFAHVDDVGTFVANLERLLRPGGIFIFEAPYFPNLLDKLEYDTIYHEHLSYFSLCPLEMFFSSHGLEIFDVLQVDIHGGSFRAFVTTKGHRPVTDRVSRLLKEEAAAGIYDRERLDRFAKAVAGHRRKLTWLLHSLRNEGRSIVGVSAPAKGMTLLNYCRIGPEILDFVTEKSSLKIGRFTPGTHIPVVPDSMLLERQPDFALLLAWNFADEIMNNLTAYREAGGRFIIPIPEPTIV
jgi:SAM-dependent methyltransferase